MPQAEDVPQSEVVRTAFDVDAHALPTWFRGLPSVFARERGAK
jgi:hypothetical protein